MTSIKNRNLLKRMLGREIPSGDSKITLTFDNLGKLLDAARAEDKPVENRSAFSDLFKQASTPRKKPGARREIF